MTSNPYQSPVASSAIPADHSSGGLPTVDGKCLVVASWTILPAVCVRTNRAVSEEDLVFDRLAWCPAWFCVVLFFVFGPLLLFAIYFGLCRKCSLWFGLQPQVKRRYRRRMQFKVAAAIALFVATLLAGAVGARAVQTLAIVLYFGAVVSLFIGNSPLEVVKRRGEKFWIKGFSDEFLAGFKASCTARRKEPE
jgi:hypothetical protein